MRFDNVSHHRTIIFFFKMSHFRDHLSIETTGNSNGCQIFDVNDLSFEPSEKGYFFCIICLWLCFKDGANCVLNLIGLVDDAMFSIFHLYDFPPDSLQIFFRIAGDALKFVTSIFGSKPLSKKGVNVYSKPTNELQRIFTASNLNLNIDSGIQNHVST